MRLDGFVPLVVVKVLLTPVSLSHFQLEQRVSPLLIFVRTEEHRVLVRLL
jgi:hypothetical protein